MRNQDLHGVKGHKTSVNDSVQAVEGAGCVGVCSQGSTGLLTAWKKTPGQVFPACE